MNIADNENEYQRDSITQQDLISNDIHLFNQKMKNFVQIHAENYEDIDTGVWIRYISDEGKYRSGGILVVNNAPTYFILKNPFKNLCWSVNLDKNIIFMKNINNARERMIQKNNLFRLYEEGLIEILDTPKHNNDA